ncbi:hypothetical protein PT974_07620 [Cladobotryum mycophilum]|uniref:2EXR domain-containing protein n=1 Tax=Cladobotryum mycophilum TaxID=491253 RepID=A0ABR0SPT7_9HYPO
MARSMASFPQFSKLPYDIRFIIWGFAIRPFVRGSPGVHRFTAVDFWPMDRSEGQWLQRGGKENYSENRYDFKLPGTNEPQPNSSMYLWDMGLWMACKESREVIKTRYGLKTVRFWEERRRRKTSSGARFDLDYDSSMRISVRVPCFDGGLGLIVINPHRDLISLDFDHREISIDWERLERSLLRPPTFLSKLGNCHHLRHVGLEFDPSWNTDLLDTSFDTLEQEASPRARVANAMQRCANENLGHIKFWLIDRYTSCPMAISQLSAPPFTRQMFHDCGRTYIETTKEDTMLSEDHSEETYTNSAHFFIDYLEKHGNSLSLYPHNDIWRSPGIRI